MVGGGFRQRIYGLIAQVPKGKVTTYGDLAVWAGSANASRVVGGIAHYGDDKLPWHRLVNRFGGLASGFPGGREVQRQLLLGDDVTCTDFIVDNFEERRWRPDTHPPLVVIVGPTASGKTSLAIDIAKRFNGEIICADSRSIYRGADIATVKPTADERGMVPHWGLDLVEPGEYFSAADFKEYANKKVDEIRSRGHVPFLVGGTGLYIDSIVFDYKFGPSSDNKLRQKLQQFSLDELYSYCDENEIELPNNSKNKRYIIRAIEMNGHKPDRDNVPLDNCIIVGIATKRQVLRDRIEKRATQIFNSGVIDEARWLGDKFGWENEAMTSNIYPLIHLLLLNKITMDDAKKRFVTLDWRLAKRQLTWLRRNRFIQWLPLNDAKTFLCGELANRIEP